MDIRVLLALACIGVAASCVAPGASAPSAAVSTNEPANVDCPGGKPARAGLHAFGAFIGTWDASRPHDPLVASDYPIGMIAGHISIRCSTDGFVIVEHMHPMFQSPAGQALRVALTELPDDSERVYDHTHQGCRTFQYRSKVLARQLGPEDNDGRVDIVFRSDGATYNPASVRTIDLDLADRLGADTRGC